MSRCRLAGIDRYRDLKVNMLCCWLLIYLDFAIQGLSRLTTSHLPTSPRSPLPVQIPGDEGLPNVRSPPHPHRTNTMRQSDLLWRNEISVQ